MNLTPTKMEKVSLFGAYMVVCVKVSYVLMMLLEGFVYVFAVCTCTSDLL